MAVIRTLPGLSEQIYQLVVDEICDGKLTPGAHLVQEQLAERFDVSRQPIQQAIALLKADGLVEDVGKRGVAVAALDLAMMRHHYQIRASLDVLAVKLATQRLAKDKALVKVAKERGKRLLDKGETARRRNQVREQIRQDEAFHFLLYELSGNPLLQQTAAPHWRFLRRVMGDVLRQGTTPRVVWQQHRAILNEVTAGNTRQAQRLAQQHIDEAADILALTVSPSTSVTNRRSNAKNS